MNLDRTLTLEECKLYKDLFMEHYYYLKQRVAKCTWDEESRDEFNKAKETLGSIVFKYA